MERLHEGLKTEAEILEKKKVAAFSPIRTGERRSAREQLWRLVAFAGAKT